jgi:hypothetical protein
MALAGLASMCAGGTTHPIDTVKIRMQKQGELGTKGGVSYNNIFRAFYMIVKNESFLSL